ncbi:alkaline phosphatase D family protein [Nocardioides sp.]|uniref:alkaline phosphatase D family protein n=1 Tax=Nocardioides sp. TaxID=35761 RepID=UPI00286DA749|nr:alkaline phosphatase D family protein [Nocardioides sp.]
MTPTQRTVQRASRHPLPRRTVLASSAAAGVGLAATTRSQAAAPLDSSGVFRHGVASGDPLPRSVVLWTRVTPVPEATPGSGLGGTAKVRWEVARDATFRKVVRSGTITTTAARDHTVKFDASGLQPETWYHYRFVSGGVASPVGRTRTAPDGASTPDHLRFGVVSCANLQAGWFSAYRHLAARDDLHAILHLGDYLYEYGPGEYGYGRSNVDVRPHVPAHEMVTVADYRQRHGQYKQDPDLQALHARYPFIVTWDDHEVANDAWREGAENHQPEEGDYLARRAGSHRAYDEWMPVRMDGTASLDDGTRLFRRLAFGQLAEISMLDLRTYRDQQVPTPLVDGAVDDPERTITGRAQLDWLKDSLTAPTQWKLVGNPVMIAPVSFAQVPKDLVGPIDDVTGILPRDGAPYNVDQWDGYTDDRREVLAHVRDRGLRDVVFLTGDIHSAWACDLPYDAATYPVGDSAGVEFVCTSVTSNNLDDITGTPPRTTSLAVEAAIQTSNRHVRYLNFDDHGYSVFDVTSARAQMDYYVIGDRADRNAAATWSTSWATRSGTNKVIPVDRPLAGA